MKLQRLLVTYYGVYGNKHKNILKRNLPRNMEYENDIKA